MKRMKKGFTIVELVIVIAVIAILAGVLIPTFSSVIKKAQVSSDQQAVRQMNTALAVEGVMEDVDIFDVFEVLEESGLSAKNYKALSSGMSFFWDAEINRVLYVDNATGKATYPEEYKDRANNGKWFSLTMQIEAQKPADSDYDGNKVTVDSGKELAYVIAEQIKKDSSVNEIALSADIDMMGAAFDAGELNKDLTIAGTESNPTTIKNATVVEAKKTYANGGAQQDGVYNTAMFTIVPKGKTLTIKNVEIDNMNLKDTNASNGAFLVGALSGTLILENVTIKNSSIIAHHNVGALVGQMDDNAKIIIKGDVKIENVTVEGVGGRIGKLIGNIGGSNAKFETQNNAKIEIANVTTGIFNCEANVGTYNGTALGLKEDGKLWSTEILASGAIECKGRVYYEGTLVGGLANDSTATVYTALKALVA